MYRLQSLIRKLLYRWQSSIIEMFQIRGHVLFSPSFARR